MGIESPDKRHEDDGHGNALGTVYDLRCSGSMKYHDYVTAESYEAMKRRAEHAYPYPEAEDWTVEELAAAYRERLNDIEQYRQWVERLQTTPSHVGRKCDSCGQIRINEQPCSDTLCAFVPSTTPQKPNDGLVRRLIAGSKLQKDAGMRNLLWLAAEAISAASAIAPKAKEYAGHGLTPEMVKAHYPQTQHQPDECQICAEVFEVAAEALAMHAADGGKQT